MNGRSTLTRRRGSGEEANGCRAADHRPAADRAEVLRLRSYVSVPVVLSDGSLYGTFCAAGLTSDKDLTRRDKALMDVLASAAAVIIESDSPVVPSGATLS
jgi:GAF domain-containing protein